MRIALIASLMLLLQSCAINPYAKYYTPISVRGTAHFARVAEQPHLVRGTDPKQDRIRMMEDGYELIGYSSFNAGNVNEHLALDQAQKVGASVVLMYSRYTNTVSGRMPLTLPSTTTSSTSVSGMVGSTPVYGSGYTATYGTTTTYIPFSVRRSDYLAAFWKKLKPSEFGVSLREPRSDERVEIGRNVGFVIQAVRNGSPAFDADLFRGDVVERIGAVTLRTTADLRSALACYADRTTTVVVWRGGKQVKREITFGAPE